MIYINNGIVQKHVSFLRNDNKAFWAPSNSLIPTIHKAVPKFDEQKNQRYYACTFNDFMRMFAMFENAVSPQIRPCSKPFPTRFPSVLTLPTLVCLVWIIKRAATVLSKTSKWTEFYWGVERLGRKRPFWQSGGQEGNDASFLAALRFSS